MQLFSTIYKLFFSSYFWAFDCWSDKTRCTVWRCDLQLVETMIISSFTISWHFTDDTVNGGLRMSESKCRSVSDSWFHTFLYVVSPVGSMPRWPIVFFMFWDMMVLGLWKKRSERQGGGKKLNANMQSICHVFMFERGTIEDVSAKFK